MDNCPFCKRPAFDCGTTEHDVGVYDRTSICLEVEGLNMRLDREIYRREEMQKQLDFLRKWREVVLSHVKSVPSMRFSTGEFIACCKIPIGKADVLDAKEAFDAAVRKEME